MQVEISENSNTSSTTEPEQDRESTCDEEIYADTSLDSSASSPFGNLHNTSIPILSSIRSSTSSTTTRSSNFDLKFPPLRSQNKLLEAKLAKFAAYGRLLEKTKSIDLFTLQEIGQDSGVLLGRLCDPEVMNQMFESGLLKEMIDTELLRRALEFFRLWVSPEALENAENGPFSLEHLVAPESSRTMAGNRDVPVLTIEVPKITTLVSRDARQ